MKGKLLHEEGISCVFGGNLLPETRAVVVVDEAILLTPRLSVTLHEQDNSLATATDVASRVIHLFMRTR